MHTALRSTLQLLKRGAIRSTLNTMGYAGIGSPGGHNGRGLIVTLHRVEPEECKTFAPNALLSITPDFLKTFIEVAQDQDMQPIAVCDIKNYLSSGNQKPFIAFTLDDGYKNNRDHAAPIFRDFDIPYTIFISKGLSERTHTLWWETAEQLIRQTDILNIDVNGQSLSFPARTTAEKYQAFQDFAQTLLDVPEDDAVRALNHAAEAQGICAKALTETLIMSGTELKALNEDPLCNLAPHTVSHINLAKADPVRLEKEIAQSIAYIRDITGDTPSSRVFSYPYGKPFATSNTVFQAASDAGMAYGVVTSPGAIRDDTQGLDWMRLPRISINGYYQTRAAAHALLCGVPTMLEKRARR